MTSNVNLSPIQSPNTKILFKRNSSSRTRTELWEIAASPIGYKIHMFIKLIFFQLKLRILIFWTKFAQKVYFLSKTENVNSAIEPCIFELV